MQPLGFQQAFDLVGFAAQANDQYRSKVGVHGVPAQGTAQQAKGFPAGVHCATGTVGQGDHAVDVRVVGQHLGVNVTAEVVGHSPGTVAEQFTEVRMPM